MAAFFVSTFALFREQKNKNLKYKKMKKENSIVLPLLDKPVLMMNGGEFLELLQQVKQRKWLNSLRYLNIQSYRHL